MHCVYTLATSSTIILWCFLRLSLACVRVVTDACRPAKCHKETCNNQVVKGYSWFCYGPKVDWSSSNSLNIQSSSSPNSMWCINQIGIRTFFFKLYLPCICYAIFERRLIFLKSGFIFSKPGMHIDHEYSWSRVEFFFFFPSLMGRNTFLIFSKNYPIFFCKYRQSLNSII